ncbi:MAG: ABC transporter ATP-binding protein [Nitrospirae bacterium]|nr:ABC transporter ATP-binding protein [Nitrospirota bacterium]
MSLLKIRDLNISFKTPNRFVNVVSSLNLDIQEGEIFGLVGESGCGKSITALSMMKILPHNFFVEGEILFKGKNLLNLDEKAMRGLRGKEISMIFQEPMTSLNPVLTIGYQIAEALIAHIRLSKKDAMTQVVDLLKTVRIPSPEIRIKEYPHQISGGMRQRVMIAMAIACNPSLLIADEPTTALDVTIQAQILELLRRLRQQKKMAIMLITHDLGVIAENAERAAIMYAGRIMEISRVSELIGTPKHPYTVGLLESLPKRRGIPLKPIRGYVPRPEQLPPGCKFSNRCYYMIPDCQKAEPELREIVSGHFVRCLRSEEIQWMSSI